MALKKDERQYKVKTLDSSVPYVPAQSYANIAMDAFKPTLQRMENDAANTAKANYFQNFQIQTNEQFDKFRIEFENDPDGMRNAVNAFSQTLLEKTPAPYKIQANAMLSSYSQNSILYAAGNKRRIDNEKLLFDRDVRWEKLKSEFDFSMSNFENEQYDFAIASINKQFLNGTKHINENGHTDLENFVSMGKITDKDHYKNLKDNTKSLMVSRVFNIMKVLDNNGMDNVSREYLYEYANGNDQFKIELDKNDPVSKIIDNLYKDDDSRLEIVNEIEKKYEGFSKKNIMGRLSQPNINFEELQEFGRILSVEQYQDGNVEPNEIADKLNVSIGSSDYRKIINIVEKNNRVQQLVSEFMQNPDQIIDFQDKHVDPKDFAEAILKNENISTVQYGSANSNSLTTAFNILSKQDIIPPGLEEYLSFNEGADLQTKPSLDNFKNKLFIYQYADNFYPHVEYNPIYQKAIDTGVLDSLSVGDYDSAKEMLKNITSDTNYDNRVKSIILHPDYIDMFDGVIKDKMRSPNLFLNLLTSEKDPLHKHFFKSSDQTTFLAYNEENIIPPNVKKEMQNLFAEQIGLMTFGSVIDPNQIKKNDKLINRAWAKVTKKIQDLNYGVSEYTFSGKPELIKEPFEKTYGTPRNDDFHTFIKSQFFQTSSDEEKIQKFGTKKWEELNSELNKYFSNKNGDVFFHLKPETYKDENKKRVYKLGIVKRGGEDAGTVIYFDEPFKPIAYRDINYNEGIYESREQLVNEVTNEIYENALKQNWYQNLENAFDWSDVTTMNPNAFKHNNNKDEKNSWFKRATHSIIRNGIKLSDFRFHPSMEGKKDFDFIPSFSDIEQFGADVRPFAWVAKVLGYKGDFRDIEADLTLAASTARKAIDYDTEIQNNQDLSDREKVIEARVAPGDKKFTENSLFLQHKHFALKNYQNEELPLTYRTNNWTAVSSDKWDGEIDVSYQRGDRIFAVFSHPKYSIRAAVRSIINHSALTENLNPVEKFYSSTPTFRQVLEKYAVASEPYIAALKENTEFEPEDKLDLLNNNQMYKFMMFVVQHEMGKETFLKRFDKQYAEAVIHEGYKEAIRSFNGKLK